ncbi:glycosyl transferase family 2 [Pseudodesulfovibrio nedwellii]|uniref:Glycosyl transferase family 2 n=1 Tax=Pseudodesulfovibrio nedwellii TaxID=2973072 RepID=A0ABM8AWC6_9BACT|nr:glycosyltransferase [Pseudodesulfovibrio nedwellii]BDQ35842.1 glycosyl transferase family 2 [Pseudodesulfovibrio nedwellii]
MKDYLLFGTRGHNHLLAAAQKAFALANGAGAEAPSLIELGSRLFCMAWAEFPLNAPLAGEVVKLYEGIPAVRQILTPHSVAVAKRIALSGHGEGSLEAPVLFAQGQYTALDECLMNSAFEGMVLPVVRQAMLYQGLLSKWGWLEGFIQRVLVSVEPDLAQLLLAESLLAHGKCKGAVRAYEPLLEKFGLTIVGFNLATAYANIGQKEKAMTLLRDLLEEFPQHTSALLFMDRLAFPAKRDVRLDGKCVVCIYSYNKADELGRTLESVLASDLSKNVGDISVRVLVNGSQDESLEIVKAVQSRFDGELDIVDLPVNVGAPAARNWLIDAAGKDGAEWVVFLDDDVIVPHDWLLGLAAGTKEFPDAGVWGCRVHDAVSPCITQHADGFVLSREDAAKQDRRVVLHEPSTECLIPSQLSYRRYASSVTGCCHLFRVEELQKRKGFNLLFSPSQFDDLDMDLRMLCDGKPAAYLGDVDITHLRVSNHLQALSEAAERQSCNHRQLLEDRHESHLDFILTTQFTYLQADIATKRARLQKAGLLPDDS